MNQEETKKFIVLMLPDSTVIVIAGDKTFVTTKDELMQKYCETAMEIISVLSDPDNYHEVTVGYPEELITTIDKVSNKAFEGVFNSDEPVNVEVIKKTKNKKAIYAPVTINYAELEGVKLNGRRELTAFDREVHDAILTLYVEGGNTFITINMIHQMMTGKKGAHCSPRRSKAINDSITKLMITHAVIDASQEAKLRGFDKDRYDSNLLNVKRHTVSVHGQTVTAIKILDAPVLYEYAKMRNQIERFDSRLLDAPINTTEENIVLSGYLRRRIAGMKGRSKLSTTIKYESIYKVLEITASSDGALRKKKAKVRETARKILDFYKKVGFINGYAENYPKSKRQEVQSITIEL